MVAGIVALSVALPAFAQTSSAPLGGVKGDLMEKFKQEREMIRGEIRTLSVSSVQGMKEIIQTKREEFKALMETQREEFKKTVEAKREEAKQTIAAKREELKDRLKELKDARKEQAVAKLYDSINALNERLTKHYLAVLEQVEKVLANVEGRADKAAANGLEVGTARTAVTIAESAIAAARTAVQAQAAKVYAVTVNASSTVKSDVQAVRQALHTDLAAVQQVVVAARDAVHQAAVTLAQIPRVDEEPSVTSTPVAEQ